jgi:hypothetical protein
MEPCQRSAEGEGMSSKQTDLQLEEKAEEYSKSYRDKARSKNAFKSGYTLGRADTRAKWENQIEIDPANILAVLNPGLRLGLMFERPRQTAYIHAGR